MNKKRIIKILTLLIMLILLTSCSIARDADGNIKLISLSTTLKDMTEEGIFSLILIYPLAQAINFLSSKIGIGMAIMLVTFILNAIVLALTFKSSLAMQKMQEVQPELNKIQKKYEGRTDNASKQKMSMEMSKLYQKYNINPATAMLTSFIQFPIMIAMYMAVQRSEAVAKGLFMGVDLSLSPAVNYTQKGTIIGLVLYVLMIICQTISISLPRILNNRRAKAEADKHHRHYEKPQDQSAMMSYSMILVIGLLMYSWPSALSLYYLIYSVVTIIKTFIVDKLTHKEG